MVTAVAEHLVDLARFAEICEPLGLDPSAFADQLSAFVAHERCGVHLYRSAAARTEVDELRDAYVQFGDETLRHVEIYTGVIEALGGDPQYVSAAARATEKANTAILQSSFLLDGSNDPATRELTMIEAVAIAETKCHANWELLSELAAALPDGPERQAVQAAVAEVQPQEDEHLTWASTARERFLLGLVAPTLDFEITIPQEADAGADEPVADDAVADIGDLASLTKSELYERAQELDIPGRSAMNKEELADAVRDAEEE
jgi:rubrerythrin